MMTFSLRPVHGIATTNRRDAVDRNRRSLRRRERAILDKLAAAERRLQAGDITRIEYVKRVLPYLAERERLKVACFFNDCQEDSL